MSGRQKLALLALASMFWWPWALALVVGPNSHLWLRNLTLVGVVSRPPAAPLSWTALREHRWQTWFEDQATHRLPGREAAIRVTNEMHFRLFGQPATLNTISVGREDTLFETGYLEEFAFNRAAPDLAFLDDLHKAQQRLRDLGVGFVLVISPSKAALVPELAPPDWEARFRPGRRQYDQFVEEVRRRGITLVDGHALTLACKRPGEPSVFPKGGVHWGERASFETGRAVVTALREQNLPLRDLACDLPTRHENPVGEDADLVNLMNLVFPWHYPCYTVNVRPEVIPAERQLNLTLLGASFSYALRRHLAASGQFAEIHHFRLRPARSLWIGGDSEGTLELPSAADQDFLAADCVVLEINEGGLWKPGLLHDICRQILVDRGPGRQPPVFGYASFRPEMPETELTAAEPRAMVRLLVPPAAEGDLQMILSVDARQPQSVRVLGREGMLGQWDVQEGPRDLGFAVPARLASGDGRLALQVQGGGTLRLRKLSVLSAPSLDAWEPCRPGKVLSFGTPGLDRRALRGFSSPESTLSWTQGSLAEIGLQLPGQGGTLSFYVAPYLHPRFLPAQRVRVFGNGHLLAVWRFGDRNLEWRTVKVPPSVLGPEGRLSLRFELASTCSPLEAGEGADPRQLGLMFRTLRLEGGSSGGRGPAAGSSRPSRSPAKRKGKRG